MYAIVVAVAFSKLSSPEVSIAFVGPLFLIVVVMEDFFLYQTQVKPLLSAESKFHVQHLVWEGGILLSWHLAYVSLPNQTSNFIVLYGLFFLIKCRAGVNRWFNVIVTNIWKNKVHRLPIDWSAQTHREHVFLISVATCVAIFLMRRGVIDIAALPSLDLFENDGMWFPLFVTWVIQVGVYWWVTSCKVERISGTSASYGT